MVQGNIERELDNRLLKTEVALEVSTGVSGQALKDG